MGRTKEGQRQCRAIPTHIYSRYRRWRRYRETVRELQGLSSRELNDLGINRAGHQPVGTRGLAPLTGSEMPTNRPGAANARRPFHLALTAARHAQLASWPLRSREPSPISRRWKRAPNPVHVVGGGLAGSEAAWQLAEAGVPVVLHEMRPTIMTPAHKTENFAELVCSNSFRSDDAETNAVGLLHAEMRRAGSLVMAMGDRHKLPAGGALAVDRDGFSEAVTAALKSHPLIRIESGEVRGAAAGRLGLGHRRDRPPHLRFAGRIQSRPRLARIASPSSTPSRRSSIARRSTWTSPGSSRATTRRARAAPAPTTSTARSTAISISPSSRDSWRPRKPSSTTGRRTRPISTAACRSR